MKTILLALFIGLHILTHAQETYEFKIYDITVNLKSKEFQLPDTIKGNIYLDTQISLDIYSDGDNTYYTQIEMRRSGNRVKLKERWLVKNNKTGETLAQNKWVKTVHFIKNSFVGEINGYSGQQVLIDKEKYYFIKTSYKRSINYGI